MKILAYPTVERGGVVWTYMGPTRAEACAARFRMARAPSTHRFVSKTFEECNYLQAMEGGLDTSHSSFAHNNYFGNKKELRNIDDRRRASTSRPTDYGYRYISTRTAGEDRELCPRLSLRDAEPADARRLRSASPTRRRDRTRAEVGRPSCGCRSMTSTPWVYNWACGHDESAPLSPEFIGDDGRPSPAAAPTT